MSNLEVVASNIDVVQEDVFEQLERCLVGLNQLWHILVEHMTSSILFEASCQVICSSGLAKTDVQLLR